MDQENTGCFAWFVRFKQSCNERWARFRNRFRRRFYARRGQKIDPSTIANETGTNDMVISKMPCRTNGILPENLAAKTTAEHGCPGDIGISPPKIGTDKCFENLVEEYVSDIIAKAADTVWMERPALLGNRNVCIGNSTDIASLSSSIISQIADTAVTESLSNIVLDSDVNQ